MNWKPVVHRTRRARARAGDRCRLCAIPIPAGAEVVLVEGRHVVHAVSHVSCPMVGEVRA